MKAGTPITLALAVVCMIGCSASDSSNRDLTETPDTTTAPGDSNSPAEPPAENTSADEPPAAEPVDVELVDLAGYQAAIAKHKGKIVVVDFWATWCEPCKERFPHLVEMSHQYPADDVAFVSVALELEDGPAAAQKFLTENKASSIHNLVSTLEVTSAFDAFEIVDGIPNYKLINRDGEVAFRFSLEANEKEGSLAADLLDIKLKEMLK